MVFSSKENANNKPQLVISSAASRSDMDGLEITRSEEGAFNSERNLKKPIIYPNPFQKNFNIKFPNDYQGNFFLEIADQIGRTYNIGKITVQSGGSNMNIDISNLSLPAGVYFLKIKSDTRSEEMKLIVQ